MAQKLTYRTRQQDELIAYLRATPGEHHTVAQICAYFDQKNIRIGTTTIYRHLERLTEEGIVHKYLLETGDSACYEYAERQDDCASHFHCKCEKCGKLIHLDCDELRELTEHLREEHGFEWHSGRTVFYGVCLECRKEE